MTLRHAGLRTPPPHADAADADHREAARKAAFHEAVERAVAAQMPTSGPLVDTFGRVHTDLRISLTDRCNLRCTYCMPAEGLDWLPSQHLLSDDELIRLMRIGVTRLGITDIRFTGGEPLLARHLESVVAGAAALRPRPEIALTTNGLGLARRAGALVAAGLDRINVSLDTVDRAHFAEITRRDRLPDVLAGLDAAAKAGMRPIKVNAVLDPKITGDDIINLLRFCLLQGYHLRVIEMMPLDADHNWNRDAGLSVEQLLETVQAQFTLRPDPKPRGSAPAEVWLVDEGPDHPAGTFGIIASVSRPFCGDCDRTRLTADGQIRNCLFATAEYDLRALLRDGSDDAAIEQAWRAAMWTKKAGHGINDPDFIQPDRPMSAIGG
ncbi:GTP 3',8-cyclase MoaA [Mycolicibacter heraklionensis]|uniref:GTP 3',8-cyclase n=1 Tax=Mycolicibacter heraklionensis TaxID=512402 RepID=A0A9X7WHS5_9MYCO|nr:GTP 3',8-cyclase MoaA [Mycolicibacter heraklionensis]QZA08531.1 GTP 3',8-cyclase MoaA [Mycolicibacter heraklionensis]